MSEMILTKSLFDSVICCWIDRMRACSFPNLAMGMVASGVDPPELLVLACERFCCGSLIEGRASWMMGVKPEFRVGVGVLDELAEATEEAGKAGQPREMIGTMLSLAMVIPAWSRYQLYCVVEVQDLSS